MTQNKDSIVCPIHKLPMYYHHKSDSFACQDIDCKYAQGIDASEVIYDPDFMAR
jgi:hypothetical protein